MRVVRNGREVGISTYDLLVGDVLLVATGDILAADGLLFQGNELRCRPFTRAEVLHGASDYEVAQARLSFSRIHTTPTAKEGCPMLRQLHDCLRFAAPKVGC